MRRIDLCCKLLAPFLTGVVLQWAEPLVTTLFVAGWNIVSFFAELGLIWLVYRLIPPLANKKLHKKSEVVEEDNDETKEDGEEPIVVTAKVSNFKSKAKKVQSWRATYSVKYSIHNFSFVGPSFYDFLKLR